MMVVMMVMIQQSMIELFSYEWETYGTELVLVSIRYYSITARKIIAQPIRMLGYRTVSTVP